jgi:hypothetical protein
MELINEFEVAVPVERAWAVLTDLERIAPCLPGAQLREVEGDEYRGSVKVKVGPITTSYDGAIRFIELDESAHHAVMKAEGRETRGQGNVAAVITATMSSSGAGTKVVVATDLTISGKVAQLGRGVLADVSAKLLDQFVANLESTVLVPEDAGSPEGGGPEDSVAAASPPEATSRWRGFRRHQGRCQQDSSDQFRAGCTGGPCRHGRRFGPTTRVEARGHRGGRGCRRSSRPAPPPSIVLRRVHHVGQSEGSGPGGP